MSDITVIGLGLMGSALARTLQRAGHTLTVWNRSVAKMQPFIDDGVAGAADLVSAISASPVILICIDSYEVTDAILNTNRVARHLAGRTVVQLSTGTPKDALTASEWMRERSVGYLDGAILAGPENIGTDVAQILFAGEKAVYERAGGLLQCLGGTVRYVGSDVGAASALDLAWLSVWYGEFISIAHGANICDAEGVDLSEFISLFPDRPSVRFHAEVIHDKSFDKCSATLQVWGAALQRIQMQGNDSGISNDFPDFLATFFKKAVAAGLGSQNVMALVKVLQRNCESRERS